MNYTVTALIALASVFLTSCNKSNPNTPFNTDINDDKCNETICQNGGSCADGICDCPEGYSGDYCQRENTPSKIYLTKIIIKKWPILNSGQDWDALGGKPDVFCEISLNNSKIFTSWVVTDATAGFELSYDNGLPFALEFPNSIYRIDIWDEDLTDNDWMGAFTFTPYETGLGFPPNITLTGATNGFEIEFSLSYVF